MALLATQGAGPRSAGPVDAVCCPVPQGITVLAVAWAHPFLMVGPAVRASGAVLGYMPIMGAAGALPGGAVGNLVAKQIALMTPELHTPVLATIGIRWMQATTSQAGLLALSLGMAIHHALVAVRCAAAAAGMALMPTFATHGGANGHVLPATVAAAVLKVAVASWHCRVAGGASWCCGCCQCYLPICCCCCCCQGFCSQLLVVMALISVARPGCGLKVHFLLQCSPRCVLAPVWREGVAGTVLL
jgi:hypothetical protein